jgi:hypothetical protein
MPAGLQLCGDMILWAKHRFVKLGPDVKDYMLILEQTDGGD